jgi:LytS/YehU family sensor histidine kinase
MPLGSFVEDFIDWLSFNLLAYAAVAGMAQALLFARLARQQEIERAVLAEQLAQAQLDALRMQLHPHFLFNALNTISMLVRERDAETAVHLIAELGDILRELLRDASTPAIPLRAELELLKRYLSIEQVRFGDRLTIEWDVEEDVLDAEVPTLILQPVVENAIRHGISRGTSVGSLRIEAGQRGQTLVLSVSDNGPGGPSREIEFAEDSDEASGIGLSNTQARLRKLYGHDAYLLLSRTAGVTLATVVLPLQPPSQNHRAAPGTTPVEVV